MKIVCDSCATKYSISDDKVRGKVFKIRCKKCSHIIVVRGTTDAASASPAAASGAEGGGWHLVVDGEQVGPLPESEIRARLQRNEINGETYIWKEGLADWLKLSTVPEFADSVSAPPAADAGGAAATSDLFTDSVPLGAPAGPMTVQVDDGLIQTSTPARSGGGLFGAIDAAANGSGGRAAMRAGAAEEVDVFSAPAASRGGGGDLFASHAAAQPALSDEGRRGGAANHDGGRVENLTAQRHENSVLFSLANLQQLAMPSVAAKASSSAVPTSNGSTQSEGSGLIDIRAMAATTLGSPAEGRGGGGGGLGDDLPTFGSFSSAAPVLLPIPGASGPPKWLYVVIGGMALLVIGIGVMAYKLFTTKPVTVVEQVPMPAPVAVAPAPTAATAPKLAAAAPAGTAAPTIPDDKLPPREGEPDPKAAGAAAKADKPAGVAGTAKKPGKAGKEKKGSAGTDTGGGKAVAAVAAPAPEPEVKKPAKGSLDDLLEGALSGKKTRPRPSNNDDDSPGPSRKSSGGGEPAASAGPLAKSAVVAGMNGIKGKITDCYNQFKVPGMAMVNVVIGKNGKVSSATVIGKFAGTPAGACVEKAVKSASFPPSEGLSTPYPFQLR
jgi:predicted Zn finger-like uncharacterized protein